MSIKKKTIFDEISALLDAPTKFVRQCLPHLSEFQKTLMNFWQRIVGHSNFFKDSDWNYFFEVTSLSTILIAQTLGQLISSGENDLKVIQDVPREERRFLRSKLFQGGLEESLSDNGSLSKLSQKYFLMMPLVK
jgi:hypothetical protein